MKMRYFLLGDYNTWDDWTLTLTAKEVLPPEPRTKYVTLAGASGSLDLTEALSGEVPYEDRMVRASFLTSEGTFADRVRLLKDITAALHGKKVQIVEPDDPEHYFLGRVSIRSVEQTQVMLRLKIEAVCDPWRYALSQSVYKLVGGTKITIINGGTRTVCPDLTVTGTVSVAINGKTASLTAGAHKIQDLRLLPGLNTVQVTGDGSVTLTFREATL